MDPTVRSTLVSLSASFALMWATVSMVAGPGSTALVALTGNLSHAGLFFGLFAVSAAAGATIGGRAMDAMGRRKVLVVAHLLGAVGYLVAGYGVVDAQLTSFVVGTVILASAMGAGALARIGAAEIFPPAQRGQGVAWLQVSAVIGAITGPVLLFLSAPLGQIIGRPPLTLVWFMAPPILLAAAYMASRATEPMEIAKDLARYHPDVELGMPMASGAGSALASVPGHLAVGGIVALAASQAGMVAVMGIAGAEVARAGYGVQVLAGVMFLHFFGMFGLSRFVGRIADRVGRRFTILAGLMILAFGGAVVALDRGVWGFGIGLWLVGVGWSFGFLGTTVLLTDVTAPARRARVLGRGDLVAQLTAAVVASAAGVWYADRGLFGLGMVAIAVVALPVVWMFLVSEAAPGRYGPTAEADPLAAQ